MAQACYCSSYDLNICYSSLLIYMYRHKRTLKDLIISTKANISSASIPAVQMLSKHNNFHHHRFMKKKKHTQNLE